MRRLEFLITAVRRSTDNLQNSAVKDAELIEYFNDGQKLIQNMIFKNNPKADIFKEVAIYTGTTSGIYDLPADIYAENALSLVEVNYGRDTTTNGGYLPIDRVDEWNAPSLFGYFVRNRKIHLTGSMSNAQIISVRVTYFKALPRFDKRWGKIQAVNPEVSLVLQPNSFDTDASTVDDVVTVIDSSGEPVLSGIGIINFGAGIWTTSDLLDGVSPGQYVCMGSYVSGRCGLPIECEPYLLDYVRKRLYGRNTYNDGDKQELFTAEQKEELLRLFQNNTKEIMTPPITDLTFLDF